MCVSCAFCCSGSMYRTVYQIQLYVSSASITTPPHVRFGGKSFLKTHPIIKARSRQTHLVSQRQASKRVVSSISSSDRLASRE
jgi:hypothetical protein